LGAQAAKTAPPPIRAAALIKSRRFIIFPFIWVLLSPYSDHNLLVAEFDLLSAVKVLN
jgi:hypothetical protein